MNFSKHDVLLALYCFISFLGVVLIGFAWYCWRQAQTAEEPISFWLAAIILLIVGAALILFGLETYVFRDDPDVWR